MTRCASCRPKDPCEKHFQAQVVQLAEFQGWKVYHTRFSFLSNVGFPDLILLRGNELLALELKRNGGKMTTTQAEWIDAFGHVTEVAALCLSPVQWPLIEAALAP